MSSGFVTESEIEEAKKRRQEEWEKVRKPDEPEEAPEASVDSRSLYHRLLEQKEKKQMEYEEAHKLSNLVKGIDGDEYDFLEFVDKRKEEAERNMLLEDQLAIEEYREIQQKVSEEEFLSRIKNEAKPIIKPNQSNKNQNVSKQKKLLSMAVKKRNTADSNSEPIKKLKADSAEEDMSTIVTERTNSDKSVIEQKTNIGLCAYSDSDDSE